jgi:hypothetical protein
MGQQQLIKIIYSPFSKKIPGSSSHPALILYTVYFLFFIKLMYKLSEWDTCFVSFVTGKWKITLAALMRLLSVEDMLHFARKAVNMHRVCDHST